MRKFALTALILGVFATPLLADENFIPQGHTYSYTNPELPRLGSKSEKFDQQVDIYQTEIYRKARDRRVFESRMGRFINNRNRQPGNYSPSY